MLVLSRKLNEKIIIDGNITVTVLGIRGNQIRLGIEAPSSVGIVREELRLSMSAAAKEGEPGQGPASNRQETDLMVVD
ncbi:carbon storage regulator CsrA [Singulisphaera rosea]